jgi:hypothetical protein
LKEFSVYGLFELFLFGRSLSVFCFIRCELGAVEVYAYSCSHLPTPILRWLLCTSF